MRCCGCCEAPDSAVKLGQETMQGAAQAAVQSAAGAGEGWRRLARVLCRML